MKKSQMLMFVVLFLASMVSAAELAVGSGSGVQGDNVTVPINLVASEGVSAIIFNITYDNSVLTFLPSQILLGSGVFSLNVREVAQVPGSPGVASIFIMEMAEPLTGVIQTGELFKASFNIKSGAQLGNSPIGISDAIVIDENNQEVVVNSYSPGLINVVSSECAHVADVNCDGAIDFGELGSYINLWISGSVGIEEAGRVLSLYCGVSGCN